MRNSIFLYFEAQSNFRNKLFDSVEAQRNFAIAKQHFWTKLKRKLIFVIELSQHSTNTSVFASLDKKRANNLLKKASIYQYYDRNEAKVKLNV